MARTNLPSESPTRTEQHRSGAGQSEHGLGQAGGPEPCHVSRGVWSGSGRRTGARKMVKCEGQKYYSFSEIFLQFRQKKVSEE